MLHSVGAESRHLHLQGVGKRSTLPEHLTPGVKAEGLACVGIKWVWRIPHRVYGHAFRVTGLDPGVTAPLTHLWGHLGPVTSILSEREWGDDQQNKPKYTGPPELNKGMLGGKRGEETGVLHYAHEVPKSVSTPYPPQAVMLAESSLGMGQGERDPHQVARLSGPLVSRSDQGFGIVHRWACQSYYPANPSENPFSVSRGSISIQGLHYTKLGGGGGRGTVYPFSPGVLFWSHQHRTRQPECVLGWRCSTVDRACFC